MYAHVNPAFRGVCMKAVSCLLVRSFPSCLDAPFLNVQFDQISYMAGLNIEILLLSYP